MAARAGACRRGRLRIVHGLALACALTAWASAGQAVHDPSRITPFSAGRPGTALPDGWQPFRLAFWKAATTYTLVEQDGAVVVHAVARRSASGLAQRLHVDPGAAPRISWRWKIVTPVPGADARRAETEDAPARLVLEFDRIDRVRRIDSAGLDFARLLSERYDGDHALLMYVWSAMEPVGTVIESPRSTHVKMVVAASGAASVGRWERFTRDYARDFEAAFGHPAPRLAGVAVMSDADNTGQAGEAFYGDIALDR